MLFALALSFNYVFLYIPAIYLPVIATRALGQSHDFAFESLAGGRKCGVVLRTYYTNAGCVTRWLCAGLPRGNVSGGGGAIRMDGHP